MLEFGSRLDASVAEVKEQCTDPEFEAYLRAVGQVLGEMLIEIMRPLYKAHPNFKPDELV
jgi:hypothetical protein